MTSLTQEITLKSSVLPEIMQYEVLDFISFLYEKLAKSQPNTLLELTLENDRMILTPSTKEFTLEQLLAESPQSALALTSEDKEWLNAAEIGCEKR
jgi:antitoxin component of MazEF toxin-antitoxin module